MCIIDATKKQLRILNLNLNQQKEQILSLIKKNAIDFETLSKVEALKSTVCMDFASLKQQYDEIVHAKGILMRKGI